jgi:hypothetical protein
MNFIFCSDHALVFLREILPFVEFLAKTAGSPPSVPSVYFPPFLSFSSSSFQGQLDETWEKWTQNIYDE